MKSFYLTLLSIAFQLLSFTVHATTYYVSPTGNNANSGTSINDPWQTITKINSTDFIGDTILFLGGSTFTGNITFSSSDNGTAANPIVIGSYGTGKAVINFIRVFVIIAVDLKTVNHGAVKFVVISLY